MSPDLCAAALLKDLTLLDDLPADTNIDRRALVRSAKETLDWLVGLGGGPFEADVLARIGAALDVELANTAPDRRQS